MEVLTTRLFAFELGGKKDLTVVTNSLGIPAALSRQTVRDIVVLGGEYRAESHITVGSVAFCGAIAVSTDSALLGVGGITQDLPNLCEATIYQESGKE